MDWRLKAHLQNLAASLPSAVANAAYYYLQRHFGSLRRVTPIKHFENAIRLVELLQKTGVAVTGKTLFELGTGRTVNTPLAWYLCGAAKVVTVDLNPYLKEELVLASLAHIRDHASEVKALFGTRSADPIFRARFQQLLTVASSLPAVLTLAGIDYRAPIDARQTPLLPGSVDCYCSTNVVEHIPPAHLRGIFIEARRLLKPGGVVCHYVDLRDHFYTTDPSITMVNFLQFTDNEWHRLAGNRFMYHNRLRAHEYLRLFHDVGFQPILLEQETDAASLQALKRGMKLDERFRGQPPEELSVVGMGVVGSFG